MLPTLASLLILAAPTLQMGTPRALHSATRLASGKVLLAGGFLRNGALLSTAELFDPATASFSPTGALPFPLMGHSATLLRDGRVLVAGGRGGPGGAQAAVSDQALLYDERTGRFTRLGAMTSPRTDHLAVLLDDGRVLLAGGDAHDEVATDSAELFDPATGRFSKTGPLGTARTYAAAAKLPDGRVLVAGGGPGLSTVLRTAELYEPKSGRFTATGAMSVPRRKLAAAALADGRVLVLGGADTRDYSGTLESTELFDPASGRFTPGPPMAAGRFKFPGAVTTVGQGVVVAGGAAGVERLEASGARFTPLVGGSAAAHYYATATALRDGSVLVAGGYTGHGQADAEARVLALPGRAQGP